MPGSRRAAGCEKVITDKVSGTVPERLRLNEIKKFLRSRDTWWYGGWTAPATRRLGCSLRDLIDWIAYLKNQGVALRSLHESIDTSTSTGKLVFYLFGALAEFDRIGEPTKLNQGTYNGRFSSQGRYYDYTYSRLSLYLTVQLVHYFHMRQSDQR
jgi:DNA invertase Pin-like site-specific DNA recombinase